MQSRVGSCGEGLSQTLFETVCVRHAPATRSNHQPYEVLGAWPRKRTQMRDRDCARLQRVSCIQLSELVEQDESFAEMHSSARERGTISGNAPGDPRHELMPQPIAQIGELG